VSPRCPTGVSENVTESTGRGRENPCAVLDGVSANVTVRAPRTSDTVLVGVSANVTVSVADPVRDATVTTGATGGCSIISASARRTPPC
jgi:hypothetical protein